MTSLGFSLIGRRAAVVAGAVAIVSTGACSDDATAPRPAAAPAAANLGKGGVATPRIDGILSPGEWDAAVRIPFRVLLPTPEGGAPATAFVTHDREYLYLAVTFDRMSPFHGNDIIGFEFDNDNDGIREDGDDILIASPSIPQNTEWPGADYYRFNGGAWNQGDAVGGGTTDVISAWGTVGTIGVFEIRHDLNSSDNAHDFSIDLSVAPVTLGMQIGVSLEADPVGSGITVDTYKPTFTTYCSLTLGKKTTAVTCP